MSVQVLRPLTMNTAPAPADFRFAPNDFTYSQQDLQNQPPPVDAFFGAGAMQYPYAQAMMEHQQQRTSDSFDAFHAPSFHYDHASKPQQQQQQQQHFFSASSLSPNHHASSSKPMAIGQAPRSVSAGDVNTRRRPSPVSHPYSVSPHDFSSVPPPPVKSSASASGRADDEEKKARRKEQNRLAQQDLRKRRMEHAQFLEGRVAELSRQLDQQSTQIAVLRSQNEQLHDAYQRFSGGRPFEFASPPLAPTISIPAMGPFQGYPQSASVMAPMGSTTPPDSAESRRESMVSYPGGLTVGGGDAPNSSNNSVHSFDLSPNTPYSQLHPHQLQPSPQGPIRTPSSSSVANHVSIGFMLGGPQGRRPSPPQLFYETAHEQAQMAYTQ